jgi:anti-sigma regulatory factor (Ser/Thr protein kinase)
MDPKRAFDIPPVFEREITIPAVLDNLDRLLEWIETVLAAYCCPAKAVNQITVATEEIFVNVANYAYPEKTGDITVRAGRAEQGFVVQYEDGGIPFNPVELPEPQTKAAIEERAIGGLGIYLVRKMTDHVNYLRLDGKNVLTILKVPEKTPQPD